MTANTDIAACRELLRGGSRTFFAASLVLPRSVSDPAIALYAFCRLADDAVDLSETRAGVVATLRSRLARAYAGHPLPLPADRAFADVVARFAIPRDLPEALLDGLSWDVEGRRYDTLDDLLAYAVRVAGTVGVMMSLLMGRREPNVVARACDLGVAMQLTNIARDVGEDARAGRLYLPLQWMREAGFDPEAWLADPRFEAGIGGLVRRLLATADNFYESAIAGIGALPRSCRPGIHAKASIRSRGVRSLPLHASFACWRTRAPHHLLRMRRSQTTCIPPRAVWLRRSPRHRLHRWRLRKLGSRAGVSLIERSGYSIYSSAWSAATKYCAADKRRDGNGRHGRTCACRDVCTRLAVAGMARPQARSQARRSRGAGGDERWRGRVATSAACERAASPV